MDIYGKRQYDLRTFRNSADKRDKTKKLMPAYHAKQLRYISTNKKVATVSASGKIIAKGKDACTVFAFAHNGVYKGIKVNVR